MNLPKPPYLGSAYYPEAWPAEQIDADITLMREAGLNVARMAEFAWSTMEPREGEFHFEWLHTAIDKLAAAGIASILCTPSATPPQWLVNKHPEILFVHEDGTRAIHGARRHACPTQPVYREYCEKIIRRMAEEFGANPHVIGWQIDNELSPLGPWDNRRPCCCPACVGSFHAAMRRQYGSIDALNAAWNLNLWSQAYEDFESIPLPRRDTWHHPSLLLAWAEFGSNAYADFIKHQADILHEYVKVPVGTDMMPTSQLDYVISQHPLDLVQINHYHDMDSLWQAAFWFDFIRPLKSARFWNTETQTSWNGATSIQQGHKAPGWCRANSWLPITLGGEANLYWLWRQHWAGQELMHASLVSAAGRPLHIFEEVREIAEGFGKAGDFLRDTEPQRSGLAVLYSQRVQRMVFSQPTAAPDFNYEQALMQHVYRPLLAHQWRPDVITPEAWVDDYQVILCPLLMTLEEADLPDRLEAWVRAGGTLIVGPLTDVRTIEGTHYRHAPFGNIEGWTGVRCAYSLPGFPETFRYTLDGVESEGKVWFDALEAPAADVLATYTTSWLAGKAAITRHTLDAGQIIVLGTLPPPAELHRLLLKALPENVRPVANASQNVLVVPRAGNHFHGLMVQEIHNQTGWLELDRDYADLLSGNHYRGRVSVPPYAVMVLRELPRA